MKIKTSGTIDEKFYEYGYGKHGEPSYFILVEDEGQLSLNEIFEKIGYGKHVKIIVMVDEE